MAGVVSGESSRNGLQKREAVTPDKEKEHISKYSEVVQKSSEYLYFFLLCI